MKTHSLIATVAAAAAALLAFAAPAAAQEATYDYPQPIVATKSRADVQAELATARAENRVYVAEAGHSIGDGRRTLRNGPVTAVTADAQPKAKAAQRVRAGLNTSSFEPQSFDGVVTAAGGAVGTLATRVN